MLLKNNPVRKIIESRLIACVASCHHDKKPSCLDLSSAVEVIKESKTCALVYNVPTDPASNDELDNIRWSFIDLINSLPINDYFILSNTSRAENAKQAIEMALSGRDMFKSLPHSELQREPIIKLEVLDRKLQSDNEAVLNATRILVSDHELIVLPLISPDLITLNSFYDLGIPLVRVLTGKIGEMSGLIDKNKLDSLAKSSKIPLFFEGGIGTPADVTEALNLGASGVLMNAAFQQSKNPIELAKAVRKAIDS
jgi:thiazole synthase